MLADSRVTAFVWILVSAAAISGLLFGMLSLYIANSRLRHRCHFWNVGHYRPGLGRALERWAKGKHGPYSADARNSSHLGQHSVLSLEAQQQARCQTILVASQ